MSITIADKTQIRRTVGMDLIHAYPGCIASGAWTNPTPLCIDTAGAASSGQPQVKPAFGVNGRLGYCGMSPENSVAVGKSVSPQRNVIIAGYSGVSPGLPVFIDDVGSDASGTASGLTHTAPSSGTASTAHLETSPVAAVAATTSFDLIATVAGTLSAVNIAVKTAISGDDTNYWTFTITNKGQAGAGTTAMLAASDLNTTKLTGGTALAAYTATGLTLSAVGGALTVAAGDVIEVTATKTASAANLVEFVADLAIATTETARPIGLGWGTDRILFS